MNDNLQSIEDHLAEALALARVEWKFRVNETPKLHSSNGGKYAIDHPHIFEKSYSQARLYALLLKTQDMLQEVK